MKFTQILLASVMSFAALSASAQSTDKKATALKQEVLARLNKAENATLKGHIMELLCSDAYSSICEENNEDSVLENALMKSIVTQLAEDRADNCPKQDCDPATTDTNVSQMTVKYSDGSKWSDYTNLFNFIIRKTESKAADIRYRGNICVGDRFTEHGDCSLQEIKLK